MVTTRNSSGSNVTLMQNKAKEILLAVGRSDITLSHETVTRNSSGRVESLSTSTSTIIGDLQFVSVQDTPILELGIAKIGDGMFFTLKDYTIYPQDSITVDSVTWELTKQIEGEQIVGSTIYQAWIAVRKQDA